MIIRQNGRVPLVDVADDSFVRAEPSAVAAAVADPARWAAWWPGARLELTRDRGVKGQQWTARWQPARRRPGLGGTQEIWLEPWGDGVVVHYFARLDPLGGRAPGRWAGRERERRVREWKRHAHALKDELEGR